MPHPHPPHDDDDATEQVIRFDRGAGVNRRQALAVMEAAGTRVDRIRPDRVKNSMPPERTWLSMSVSEPSWLLGKISIETRPFVSLRIASAISLARVFIGCATGRLFAYL